MILRIKKELKEVVWPEFSESMNLTSLVMFVFVLVGVYLNAFDILVENLRHLRSFFIGA